MTMQSFKNHIILFLAQGAYSGKFPIAPGTAGTAVGVLLYFLIKDISPFYYLFICIVVYGIGTWTSGEAEKLLGKKDASSIVIDEIAGFFVSMFMVPFGWGFVIAGFFLFRFFDILKPWPINRIQDLRGGTGVMLDDIGAGLYTNAVLQVSCYFWGGR
jgi:phosphatidylglycerophosphatase A